MPRTTVTDELVTCSILKKRLKKILINEHTNQHFNFFSTPQVQIKKNEKCGACSMHGKVRTAYRILSQKLDGRSLGKLRF
jgi:gluconate kinase